MKRGVQAWFWRVIELPCALIFFGWIRLVFATVRFEVEGTAVDGPAIYVSWHRHSVVLCTHHGRFGRWLMSSPAPYLGAVRRLATWFGLRLALGTSGDGGASALDILTAALQRGEAVTLAVDGPAGPAFHAKRGCLLLAKRTGAPIVPVAYRTRSRRSLTSRWDKMLWVSFFDVVTIRYGTPIRAGESSGEGVLAEVERALRALDPYPE